MRVHISMDMEGVAGIADLTDTLPGSVHYEYGRHLMTQECNAVIQACVDAGATDVIVNDSHGTMLNLLAEELHPDARVVRGWAKPYGMAQGIDREVDAALFVGYHAAAGNGDGVLNHTMTGKEILGVHLNTEPAGELRLNAALAGWFGVPVILVSGDDVVCAEARSCLGDVETVEVKESVDRYCAVSLHPSASRSHLREGTGLAIARSGEMSPYVVEAPARLRIEWTSSSSAALCESVPGVTRVSARGVEASADDYSQLYRLWIVLGLLVSTTAALHG